MPARQAPRIAHERMFWAGSREYGDDEVVVMSDWLWWGAFMAAGIVVFLVAWLVAGRSSGKPETPADRQRALRDWRPGDPGGGGGAI